MNEDIFIIDFNEYDHAGVISKQQMCFLVFPPYHEDYSNSLPECPVGKHAIGKAKTWNSIKSYFFTRKLVTSSLFFYTWLNVQQTKDSNIKSEGLSENFVTQLLKFWKKENGKEFWQRFLGIYSLIGISNKDHEKLKSFFSENSIEYSHLLSSLPEKISLKDVKENFNYLINYIENYMIIRKKWKDVYALTSVIMYQFNDLDDFQNKKIKKIHGIAQKFVQNSNRNSFSKGFKDKPSKFI